MRRPKRKILRPVQPNAGLCAAYRKRLLARIDAMHRSVLYWITAQYRATPPRMAQDDVTPAQQLRKAVREMRQRWQTQFDEAAPAMAKWFAESSEKRSQAAMKRILQRGGFSVPLTMTPEMRDVLQATIGEQVGLIRTIPQQYLGAVEGAVMRSVQAGRDLGTLTKFIERSYGLARKRAALIARDQNNKATGTMVHARQLALGLKRAVWMHSHAGKEPRPTHVKMDGKLYDLSKGMWDSDEGRYVIPGELINCRCTSRPVLEGVI